MTSFGYGAAIGGQLDAFAVEAGPLREAEQRSGAAADVEPATPLGKPPSQVDVCLEPPFDNLFGSNLLAGVEHLVRTCVVANLQLGHAALSLRHVRDGQQIAVRTLAQVKAVLCEQLTPVR